MAEAGSFSEGQVKSIEKIVKEYLINHPEIMLEVQEAYEKKVEVKRGSGKKAYVETVEQAQLAQRPEVQSALIAVDPVNGHLTAMVGGYDYDLSQFNRATQARRQAGSSIKPYIYSGRWRTASPR